MSASVSTSGSKGTLHDCGPTDDVSLVRDDVPFRCQRRVGLIPREGGLGVGRRALFLTTLTWLPIAVWAGWAGRALPEQTQAVEPLLQHFGVHTRLLLGIPLLIIAEAVAQQVMTRLVPQFVHAGIVSPDDLPRFHAILASTVRLRNAVLPWVVIGVLAFSPAVIHRGHELSWASESGPTLSLGFGGWWYVYVGRPMFLALLLGWMWRLVLLTMTLKRIANLRLVIVPTHPDRAGGLGFVERFPTAFSLVVFVLSAAIAAGWAHDAEFHGLDVHSLYPMMAVGLAAALVVFLSPLLVFGGPLLRAKRQALLDYGALVGRHGALVRNKWILRETKDDDPILSAPELGPVADVVSLYEAVSRMRPAPLGTAGILAIAVPILIPFLCVLAIQIPVKDLLLKLAKGLL
jgi:hypothetical protein